MELILASNSPRRKDLLKEFGFDFKIISSNFNEIGDFNSPSNAVKSFAYGKAKDVFDRTDKKHVVLGADTIVVFSDKILGKPKNVDEAFYTLKQLSGKTHSVLTGYAILSPTIKKIDFVETKVTFNNLTDSLIKDYVASGLPLDKAGSYGIQDGYDLVKNYDGSFNNVVGLPIEVFAKELKDILKE